MLFCSLISKFAYFSRVESIGQGPELVALFKRHKIAGDVLVAADLTSLFNVMKVPVLLRRLLKTEVEELRSQGECYLLL